MNIIPKPLKASVISGTVFFSSGTAVNGDFPSTAQYAAKILSDKPKAPENILCFEKDNSVKKEGYSVSCRDGNIYVKASDESGAFYAFMTLCQLAGKENYFDAVSIEDAPKYSHRGFMLDSARHFWTVDKVKQILDVMALLKMNIFHWHLTDDQGWRVEIKKYPLLTEKGAIRSSTPLSHKKEKKDCTEYGRGLFYTQEQIKEVVAYAAERHINIIPEIDMPGHLVAAISCYPELSCTGEKTDVSNRWGIMDNIGCCGKENVYNFAKDIIDELCELFPYPYFHIGGDEVPKKRWKKCPACQAKIKELGLKDENALQGYFNNVICEYLKGKGRTTIGWNEILEASDNLDKNIIPQWWIKGKPGENLELKWLKNGGKMIISFADYVYMDHAFAVRPLKKTYSFSAAALGIKDDKNVIGMEAPQWTEYVRTERKFDLNTYVRLIAIAEAAWTAENLKDYNDFESRMENMRDYFTSAGARLAPPEIYHGKTVSPVFGRTANGWKKWRKDPDFELKLSEKYGF